MSTLARKSLSLGAFQVNPEKGEQCISGQGLGHRQWSASVFVSELLSVWLHSNSICTHQVSNLTHLPATLLHCLAVPIELYPDFSSNSSETEIDFNGGLKAPRCERW